MTHRQESRISIDLLANKYIGDEPFLCRTRNLSIDGAYLLKILEPQRSYHQELIGIEFSLPGNQEIIWVSGEVIREDNINGIDGIAVRFLAMAEKHRHMLENFVEHTGGWVCQ